MNPRELLLTATRAFSIYLLMLIVMRSLGKRTVGNFAAFDLVVALMLGESSTRSSTGTWGLRRARSPSSR